MLNYTKILFLFCIFYIGCVSTSKYDALKQSSYENEKKLKDELNLEKDKSARLIEEQKADKTKLAEDYDHELKSKQDIYNDLLREKKSLRNDSRANKAQNRRIEIVVVPDLSLLPGYNDLKKLADNNTKSEIKKEKVLESKESR
jgi:hypothetical protein